MLPLLVPSSDVARALAIDVSQRIRASNPAIGFDRTAGEHGATLEYRHLC
jgi:hypothetical protein